MNTTPESLSLFGDDADDTRVNPEETQSETSEDAAAERAESVDAADDPADDAPDSDAGDLSDAGSDDAADQSDGDASGAGSDAAASRPLDDSPEADSAVDLPDDQPADERGERTEETSEPEPGSASEGATAAASDEVDEAAVAAAPGDEVDDAAVAAAAAAAAAAAVSASTAAHGVGTTDEMDAWLSQSAEAPAAGWMSTDAEADAAMEAWLAADPNAVVQETPVVISGGKVERARPPRTPLVPPWLPWVLIAVLVVGGLAAGTAALLAARARVLVPTVAGLTTPAARDRLATVGLTLTVADRRFSTLPIDTVLSQAPDAGSQAQRGSAVTVVVSAGTEEFTMPDIVGEGLTLARAQLEQRGLEVQVEPQSSDQPSDTVLATNPAAGSPMHTGDIVKLTVSTGGSGSKTTSSTLVPYSMTGVKVTLDAAPPIAGQPDASFEVARRVQSLLEASGATVVSLRSVTDTGAATSATARQARAREGSPTVSVGFDVTAAGTAGIAVTYPSSTVATASAASSQMLASQISSALAGAGLAARQVAGGSDVVLSVTNAPYSRVTLGSTSSPDDLANFRDPNWADKVARSVYQGIAVIYGVRNPNATTP